MTKTSMRMIAYRRDGKEAPQAKLDATRAAGLGTSGRQSAAYCLLADLMSTWRNVQVIRDVGTEGLTSRCPTCN